MRRKLARLEVGQLDTRGGSGVISGLGYGDKPVSGPGGWGIAGKGSGTQIA